jgi:hypothetical protein
MATKLTLSMDEDLIRFAHELARERNESVSGMVATYLYTLKEKKHQHAYKPRHAEVRKLSGILKASDVPEDKKGIREAILRKHLQ